MEHIVKGESTYCTRVVGDSGTSYGCVQIHLPAHPEVTKAEALDPDFSFNFLGEWLSKGKCKWWTTCPES